MNATVLARRRPAGGGEEGGARPRGRPGPAAVWDAVTLGGRARRFGFEVQFYIISPAPETAARLLSVAVVFSLAVATSVFPRGGLEVQAREGPGQRAQLLASPTAYCHS